MTPGGRSQPRADTSWCVMPSVRLRAADGFSHSRSLAYATSLVFVQGLIALVGLAVELGQAGFNRTILGAIENAVPGPAGSLLVRVFAHAQQFALEHRFLPLLFGLAGTLVTATTATAQLIRGINRLYGIEKDGPFITSTPAPFCLPSYCSRPSSSPARC
jgi:uncharacterized BrkB/YihY/UPF0761 family membrane protein